MKVKLKNKSSIAKALQEPKPKRKLPVNDLTPYRFTPGTVANPTGANGREYAVNLSRKIMQSHPPKALCLEIGVDPECTWGEAIMFALSSAAARGDVAAAREVLAALGFSGTAAKNLFAVQNNVAGGLSPTVVEFLKASHGLTEEQLTAVFESMKALPREAIQIDASYLPPAEENDNDPSN